MDTRTQRRLRRERERELPNLVEDILNLLPKKLIENNDFASLKNKLMENIQNGNNKKWIGTKFFTVLSVIKDWSDEKLHEISEGYHEEPEDYSPCSLLSDFGGADEELINKSYLFQKKLNELYPNKFTLSNRYDYKKLGNELNNLYKYVEDKITSQCFPAWMDGYDEYWNSAEENETAISTYVLQEFWDKHILDLLPDDYDGYHGRKWIAGGGVMAWLESCYQKRISGK